MSNRYFESRNQKGKIVFIAESEIASFESASFWSESSRSDEFGTKVILKNGAVHLIDSKIDDILEFIEGGGK